MPNNPLLDPRKRHLITPLTDQQWPADHPLRAHVEITGDVGIAEFLICAIKGEQRNPVPAGDADIEGECWRCHCDIVHFASGYAPHLKTMCWRCWEEI